MDEIASQITSLTIVYSTVYSDEDQRKHQSSASLAFVRGIHRGPVNSPHKWPVTRKMFPFDDVIMLTAFFFNLLDLHPGMMVYHIREYSTMIKKIFHFLCAKSNTKMKTYGVENVYQSNIQITVKQRCTSKIMIISIISLYIYAGLKHSV